MRPALDPIIENQPVVAVENDSDNDTLKAKTVKDNKPKEEEVWWKVVISIESCMN